MKIKSLLIGMLASTAFVACTNDVETVENGAVAKGEKSYVAVNLVTPNAGSRAGETPSYKNGSGDEVKVGKIRFYFFGDNGAAYQVTDADHETPANYIEINNPTLKPNTPVNSNVDKISDAVLVINKSKIAPPKSVVAVINADKLTELGTGSLSLTQLTNAIYNVKVGIAGTGENEFIMSNSVYVDAAGNTVVATPITMDNVCKAVGDGDEDGAKDHPINIYVERVVAKVSTGNLKVGQTFDTDAEFGGKKVYAQINGWAITNYNDESYLFKSLEGNSAWTSLSFTWNAPVDFRSFWAKSATPTTGETYNATYKNDHAYNTLTSVNEKYCLENTSNNPTQLLVAATLVTKNGEKYEPLEIAQWMGVKYTVEGLKEQLAGTLASDYYYYDSTDKKYKSITKDHIAFENPENNWSADEKRYTVKAVVASNAPKFFVKNGEEMEELTANTEINTKLAKYPVMIWTGGATYYFLPIKHIGTENGIVRNHLYDITINGVASFGTPVYDPKEVILPQTPEDDETYISAKINILSWKVVSQTVTLK